MRLFLSRFTAFELLLMSIIAALGVAVKPLVNALSHLISSPLFIPGGALAGGIYMLFVVLGAALVKKRGAATLIGVVQAILILALGLPGSHGAFSLLTYTAPGLAIDLLWLSLGHRGCCLFCCFLAGMAANLTGTLLTNSLFFRLPALFLALMLTVALFSGGLGGVAAWRITKIFQKHRLVDSHD
ncbi:MAG: ECF transporter S component [Clostridiales bacterium]|jgi:ABC-type thiamin/hydroxymethylpyrimidine transport system permease subunit|nr:ECF transporter S component [Clostridiales bacterium]MDR2713432.1 ECF transporter S component [Clostridiales bacterium]